MAARLTRAKRKIAMAGIPLRVPTGDELHLRLDGVAMTIYLAFTAGCTPGTGADLLRSDLAGEAVELATILHGLVPDAPQARALRALLLLQHSRRDQGTGLVTLADQDRPQWHHDEIATATALLDTVSPGSGYTKRLRLEALIAREHAVSASAEHTNWPAIAGHYADLETMTGSPVVRLNRAIAVAENERPSAALAFLAPLDDTMADNHRLRTILEEVFQRFAALSRQVCSRVAPRVSRRHRPAGRRRRLRPPRVDRRSAWPPSLGRRARPRSGAPLPGRGR
jgi:RNA polymerase sigma-70 factor (ECF subfamily)